MTSTRARRRGRTRAPFGARMATITGKSRYGAYVVLECSDGAGPRPQPGQFYMLRAADRWGGGVGERPFLPRAFSVLRVSTTGERDGAIGLEFLVEDVGPGTKRLCELVDGDGLSLVGPLGQGFVMPRDGRRALLVGGGVGIAPLAILQDELERPADGTGGARFGDAVTILLGFRDADHAAGGQLLRGARVATDDGSSGHHGLVTELLHDELDADSHAEVYACGPPAMLEAVRLICAVREIPGQLALESGMACGFGACFGCVIQTRTGYVRLCLDGPVLEAAQLGPGALATPGLGH